MITQVTNQIQPASMEMSKIKKPTKTKAQMDLKPVEIPSDQVSFTGAGDKAPKFFAKALNFIKTFFTKEGAFQTKVLPFIKKIGESIKNIFVKAKEATPAT